ncbi:hypothetical protein [Agrobacterium vitis]|uniref:hypothetical protein n=1 Tax=Agrobacterium vitis TaxID=373 RepID=UPI0012E77E20|nr:hypothetical protein [Agrobacterium vitis]MUZ66362.1 hypothetical protein [Agrobacterium vitis]
MSRINISNVEFSGFGTGIEIQGSSDVEIKDVSFRDTELPFNIETTGQVRVSGTTFPQDERKSKNPHNVSSSRVGYTGNEGPSLPAMCPQCHAIFPSKRYRIRTPEFYGRNNKDICPECGCHEATVANGLFDLARETIVVLQAEPLSHAMFTALRASITSYAEGQSTEQQLVESVSQHSPKLAGLFKKALGLNGNSWEVFVRFSLILATTYTAIQLYDRFTDKPAQKNLHIEQTCMGAYVQACTQIINVPPDASVVRTEPPSLKKDNPGAPLSNESPDTPTDAYSTSPQIKLPNKGPIPTARPDAK